MRTSRSRRLLAAALVAMGLTAGACGGGETPQTGSSTTRSAGPVDEGTPQPGGTLLYALEADSDGWDPTRNRWAISGTLTGLAVFDPLAQFDAEGVARPYLAASIEPNEDYTVWTITLREGVTFHDGSPLEASAVQRSLEGHMASGLTKPAVAPMEEVVVVDTLTLEVRMNQPWVAFPAVLTAQVGVVPAPAMLDDLVDGPRNPVGTGPFVFESWTIGDRFSATKNPDYWREGLPYLDAIEFRIVPEVDTRVQALQAGNVDVMHTSDPESISRMQSEADGGKYQIEVTQGEGEESFVMLNLESPPLDDVRVRRALAHATDRQTYVDLTADGLPAVADSLFTPESKWYAATDYPEFDLAAAQALVEEYEAEVGPIRIDLATTNSTDNQRSIALLADMWAEVGIEAVPAQYEQNKFIVDALGGNYQANLWRQFGAIDPDSDAHWWRSDSTLNFANIDDEEVDEALRKGRESPADADRIDAYAALQERFNTLVPYIWLHHSVWAVAYQNDVHGVTASFPDDPEVRIPLGGNFTAVHLLTEMWKDG